ncbi:MAG: peptide chain release factor N(5)-glutamine methyltransferase [Pseudomonadota bacterium]
MKLGEALMEAQARLQAVSDSARLDAELLLSQLSGLGRAQLVARLRDELPPADAQALDALVARRARGEPIAYITGEKGFWTLRLQVTPAVLVPRPETELLVEWALELLRECRAPRIADLGTGSGAIALALAAERPDARVEATEASEDALAVARRNATDLGLERVQLHHGHWLEPLEGSFDLLLSNPPYVAHDDPHLDALRHEPLSALTDGGDGLNALREIVATAPPYLRAGGWLLVEHGYDQGAAVRELFRHAGFAEVATRRDYAGQERATAGRNLAAFPLSRLPSPAP